MAEQSLQDEPFKPGEPIIAAVGRKPEKGEDAVVYIYRNT